MNSYNDVKLINLFTAGSSQAFEELLSRHRRQVYGYILSLVKQTGVADDIFQETCIKVIATLKRGAYKESGKFIGWFLRVAHNRVMDYFRSRRNQNLLVADEHEWDLLSQSVDRNDTLTNPHVGDRQASELRRLICYLSPEQREVLVMRYYMGMTHQAIADKLHIGLNTALGRMRYAIANLQKMVSKDKSLALHAVKFAS